MHPVFQRDSVALITGSASGIGLAIAQRCAGHGMKLALADIDGRALNEARTIISKQHPNVAIETFEVDVSQLASWKQLKTKVLEAYGGVHLLVLNAAVAPTGSWEDVDYFHKIMDTNLFGVINGIATFVPVLQAQAAQASDSPAQAIVITGSKQGITNPPGNPAYNASKAAIKSLAEHLSYDLRSTPRTSVHLLIPGWTWTGLTAVARASSTSQAASSASAGSGSGSASGSALPPKPEGAWEAEQVARHLEQRMSENQFYVLCPDNDVSEDLDRRRALWHTGDLVHGRPPLSRWREDWKDRAKEGVERISLT